METIGKSFVFGLILLAMVSGIGFASLNPKIQLQNYSISEVPATPGHVISITLHLKSIEPDNCADRVAVQLAVSYPFSLQGSDTQYIDRLCSADPVENGTLAFLLPVDSLAPSGTYQVMVATTYEKRFSKFSESNTINLRIGGQPSFTTSVASSTPVDIYPGDSAQVTVTFQNNGNGRAESARATLFAPEGIEVKWAGKTQELGRINAFGSSSATFAVEALKGTQPGNYPLTLQLDYLGEDKSPNNATFQFILPVKQKAEFAASVAESTALMSGEGTLVSLILRNTGTQEAHSLKVRIRPLFPFSTDGTVHYVDSLVAGGQATLTYLINTDTDATDGRQLLSLIVDFEDPQGRKFSETADFPLLAKSKTIVDMLLGLWYVIVVAVAAVAFIVSKKMEKKEQLVKQFKQ